MEKLTKEEYEYLNNRIDSLENTLLLIGKALKDYPEIDKIVREMIGKEQIG